MRKCARVADRHHRFLALMESEGGYISSFSHSFAVVAQDSSTTTTAAGHLTRRLSLANGEIKDHDRFPAPA